jgi:hypothetical protein
VFRQALAVSKRLVPFLGESHYYARGDLALLGARINAFELRRDPVLAGFANLTRADDRVERLVFLQRMFFSDARTLAAWPAHRQRKWRHHFAVTGVAVGAGPVSTETVIGALAELLPSRPGLAASLHRWCAEEQSPGFDVYHADLGDAFRILAPHLYLWFRHDREARDRRLLAELLPEERRLVERQIDWEIWGLYCQRHGLRTSQVLEHLARLTAVRAALAPGFDEAREREVLRALFREPSAVLT